MVAGSVLWRTALSRKEYQVLLVRVTVLSVVPLRRTPVLVLVTW